MAAGNRGMNVGKCLSAAPGCFGFFSQADALHPVGDQSTQADSDPFIPVGISFGLVIIKAHPTDDSITDLEGDRQQRADTPTQVDPSGSLRHIRFGQRILDHDHVPRSCPGCGRKIRRDVLHG